MPEQRNSETVIEHTEQALNLGVQERLPAGKAETRRAVESVWEWEAKDGAEFQAEEQHAGGLEMERRPPHPTTHRAHTATELRGAGQHRAHSPHQTEGAGSRREGMQRRDGMTRLSAGKPQDSPSAPGFPWRPRGKNLPTGAGAQVGCLVREDSTKAEERLVVPRKSTGAQTPACHGKPPQWEVMPRSQRAAATTAVHTQREGPAQSKLSE